MFSFGVFWNMKKLLTIVCLLLAGAAQAGPFPTLLGVGAPPVASSYTGPGDVVSGASFWGGLRAYSAAIASAATQKLVNIRRASDNETCDLIVTTAGGIGNTANCSGADNGISQSAFCNATTCFVTKLYDQSGNSRDQAQATAANQPAWLQNCISTNPCMASNNNGTESGLVQGSNFTPATGAVTFSMVSSRITTGVQAGSYIRQNAQNNRLLGPASTNTGTLTGGSSGSFTFTMADAAWHAVNAVLNGASSVVNMDGTETTGTATGNSTAGAPLSDLCGCTTTNIEMMESGFWDNTTFTGGNRTSMCHNQFTYWGTATSC